jgi:glycosyltransferase involved in cell wall biosynthesis
MTERPRHPDAQRPTIAVVSDAIWPYHRGGKEMRYHHLCQRLAQRGFDLHVFTMQWWDGPRTHTEAGVRYTAISRRWEMYVGERRSILQAVMFGLGCLRLMRHRFDAIEADHMPYLPLFPIRLVATLKRVPLTVTWHEVWGAEYWREYLGPAGRLAAALEWAAMRLPDHILAVTEETRDRLVAAGVRTDRVTVVPNGVDVAAIRDAAPSPETFDLVFVGRLIEHKRVADLIDAVALLAAEGTPLTCAIVGDGPERERLEQRAAERGVSGSVRVLGLVDDQTVVYGLVKSSGCFVLPSVREGFGIAVVEAYACGVPVITTDHHDNHARLLVDDGVTGWLSGTGAEQLAATIRRSLGERIDPSRVAATLHRCDWDRIADDLADLLAGTTGAAA